MAQATLDELEIHFKAYFKLFQAVLNKKNAPEDTKKAVYKKLQEYVQKNIKSTDDFINHIQDFSRMLAVPEAALANFIGTNFLNALNAARKEPENKAPAQSVPKPVLEGGGKKKIFDSLISEILHRYGGMVAPPDHFENLEMGLLKLIHDSGELLPLSLTGAQASAETGKAALAQAGIAPNKPSSGGTGAVQSGNAPVKKESVLRPPEKQLIDQILEKFGNVLDIPEKLEVPDFPAEQASASAVEASPSSAPAPRPARNTIEKPIIDEILRIFGNHLDIPGKLEPSDGLGSAASMGGPSNNAEAEANDETGDVDFEPIPCEFQDFMAILRKVQEFRASGDQNAYRQWLQEEAGPAGMALVGLKNMEGRLEQSRWNEEYSNLSVRLHVEREAVVDLHNRMRVFTNMQKSINELTGRIKALDSAALNFARKIWSQILQLFNQPGTADGYESQMKMILLQVPDASAREKLINLLKPVFAQMEELYNRIS